MVLQDLEEGDWEIDVMDDDDIKKKRKMPIFEREVLFDFDVQCLLASIVFPMKNTVEIYYAYLFFLFIFFFLYYLEGNQIKKKLI